MGLLSILFLVAIAAVHARAGFLPTVSYTGCPLMGACSSSIVNGATSTTGATVITTMFVTGTCSGRGKTNTRNTLVLSDVATLCGTGATPSAAQWATCAQLPAAKTFMCAHCTCA